MHGGRVGLLLLLFALALYMFYTSGFPAFAVVCASPLLVLGIIITFRYRMMIFWMLILINFVVQWKNFPQTGIPISMFNEAFELLLIALAIVKAEQDRFSHLFNPMFVALGIWCTFCTLELLNDTIGIGIQPNLWYTGVRLMAFQLMYGFVVFTLYVTSPKILIRYLIVWACLAVFAAIWVWKQKYIGMTVAENAFLQGRGRTTHIINGGATIRYFSIFSDAANFGINMGATAAAFLVFGITSKIRLHKIIFFITGVACIYAFGVSGTRSALIVFLAGVGAYVFLSKSFRIAIPAAIVLGTLYVILAFTTIGNGNAEVRRMRSAFNKEDASMGARADNKAAMKKYLNEIPWGIGIGNDYNTVPSNNKFRRLATIPPDSEYVYIWVHTGNVGIVVFCIVNAIILLGACWIVFFRLKSKSLQGIASGLCCSFICIHLGGYVNQVLMQFPNCLLFYGGIAIVYVLPHMEEQWNEYEAQLLEKQNKKKRLKEEKRLESRV